MDDPNQSIGGSLSEVLDSEPVKNLLGPITQQLGETLGYIGSVVRFYSHENLGKIFTKWAEFERQGKSLNSEEFKRVMPLLPLASLVSDNDLQDRWAALLETAAKGVEDFLPSFGQTLSQLTASEAKFIDKLFAKVMKPLTYAVHHSPGRAPLSRITLIGIYDPEVNTEINAEEYHTFRVRMTDEQVANFDRLERAELAIQDLERLGILLVDPPSDSYFEIPRSVNGYRVDSSLAGKKLAIYKTTADKTLYFSVSPYGLKFIRAVTTRTSESAD